LGIRRDGYGLVDQRCVDLVCEAAEMTAYVSGDEVDEVMGALRVGVALVVVAAKLRIPPKSLAAALGVPEKPARWPEPVEDEIDLFEGVERLEGIL
jgi:hypothetical protein